MIPGDATQMILVRAQLAVDRVGQICLDQPFDARTLFYTAATGTRADFERELALELNAYRDAVMAEMRSEIEMRLRHALDERDAQWRRHLAETTPLT